MGETNPVIIAGGSQWRGWKRAAITYGANKAVRAFALTNVDSTNPFAEQWNFMPGTAVKVMEGGDLIIDGYINRMEPSYDKGNHHVEVNGRSKAQDAVDSSAEHKTGEWKNKTILDIAKDLDKQNIGFESDLDEQDMPKIDFRLNPFETVFDALERIRRKQGLLMIGQANGGIKITKGGTQRVNGPLIEGVNIISGGAIFDDGDTHSEYKVKGQRTFGSDKKSLRIEAVSKNDKVKRHRPRHLHQESDLNNNDAQKRADNTRDRQQGKSISARAKVQGWRDQNGVLYKENSLIYVYSPMWKLNMDLLIENVSLTMDENGSFAELSLVQPKALGSKAGTGSKTDPVWQQ